MTDRVEMQPIASMVVGGHPRVPAVANTSAMGAVAIVVTNMFVGMFVVTIERRTDGDVRGHRSRICGAQRPAGQDGRPRHDQGEWFVTDRSDLATFLADAATQGELLLDDLHHHHHGSAADHDLAAHRHLLLPGRAVAAVRRDLHRVGLEDVGDVVLECATAGGYRALDIRPRITVPAGHETWKRFATTRTTGDIAGARVAVDPLLAGAGAKP